MASAKLTRTPSSVGNSKTWTYSMWIKLSGISTEYVLFHNYGSDTTSEVFAKIGNSSGVIEFALRYNGTYEGRLITNRLFRDPNAWYHLVFVCDTTSATATNRQRIYVNGVEETSFSTDTNIAQNAGTVFNQAYEHTIGSYGSGNYFDGLMAHVHMTDGTAYQASDFGETDSTSGIWKPKTSPSVTYGTNGFFLDFATSTAGNDVSGNNNDYTTSGTITQTEDTPSNNFCTFNPLDNFYIDSTYSNGNTTQTTDDVKYGYSRATMGVSSGKWYWEIKVSATSGYSVIGVASSACPSTTTYLGNSANSYSYYGANGNKFVGGVSTSYGSTYTTNDIIGVALDLDNNKLYFSKNGTFQNSGDPTSGATGTGAISITDPASTTDGFYFPSASEYDNTASSVNTYQANFGNGKFGTTSLASSNSDSAGLGLFEYSVPSGYYALCTKNIKNYG